MFQSFETATTLSPLWTVSPEWPENCLQAEQSSCATRLGGSAEEGEFLPFKKAQKTHQE